MCSVCLEDFNKTKNLRVSCPQCEYASCRTCVQTYLLSTIKEPHCMNCKREWNREFMDSFCTIIFRNRDYKLHRENVLLEREKARMPETQPYVARVIELKRHKTTYFWLLKLLERVKFSDEFTPFTRTIIIETIREVVSIVTENIRAIVYGEIPVNTSVTVINRCPSSECRGFLHDDYTCGVCNVNFCVKCHEPNEQEHVCDANTVKTISLLKRDTKPCPSCNAPIHRIEGCAQMWCTQCQTAFDWRTGQIETGRIHNPHYFEFKKRSREHGDIPCGGRPTHYELLDVGASEVILSISSKLIEMDQDLVYKYGFLYGDNLHLRIQYMLNKITEHEFKTLIQRRDKHNSKMRDIQHIYEMYIHTVSDILRQYMLDRSKETSYIEEIRELTDYTNMVMERLRKRYTSRVPHNIMLE